MQNLKPLVLQIRSNRNYPYILLVLPESLYSDNLSESSYNSIPIKKKRSMISIVDSTILYKTNKHEFMTCHDRPNK